MLNYMAALREGRLQSRLLRVAAAFVHPLCHMANNPRGFVPAVQITTKAGAGLEFYECASSAARLEQCFECSTIKPFLIAHKNNLL